MHEYQDYQWPKLVEFNQLASGNTRGSFGGTMACDTPDFQGLNLAGYDNASLAPSYDSVDFSRLYAPGLEAPNVVFSGSNFSRADLEGANLQGADLSRANLQYTNFKNANLTRANLTEADLRGANLRGADLRGCDLSSANISGVNLSGALLDWAVMTQQQQKDIGNAMGTPVTPEEHALAASQSYGSENH